jgi:hypothetical protein
MNDYNDPELKFPRLEARLLKLPDGFYRVQIWLRREPGEGREQLVNKWIGGSALDAHEYIREQADKFGAEVGPDDIWTE